MRCLKMIWRKILLREICSKEIELNKALVAKTAQGHWDYPMSIDVLITEKYDSPSKEPNYFNYIVFIDREGDVDWECDGGGTQKDLPQFSSSIISKAMVIEGMPCAYLSRAERLAFKKMVGAAIVHAFEKDCNGAEAMLKSARAYYNDRTVETSRIWSTVSLFVGGLILCLVFLFLGGFQLETFSKIYRPMTFGAFGAFVSHFRRIAFVKTDCNYGKLVHILNASGHLFCGVVLGLLGVLFFKSGFCPNALRGVVETDIGCCVISFTAGLVETFIPSLLTKFVVHSEESEASR